MSQFVQDNRLFQITTPLGTDVLLVDHFSGTEVVSAPFRFDIRVFSEDADIELKSLMGQAVAVDLGTFSGASRYFHGHVVAFSHSGSDGGFAFFNLQVGPWTEFLRRRVNCRLFQEMKVEDILRKVFADYGAIAKFDIRAKSKLPRTLCVQYNESDFHFVTRLMEELGWHYYYTHSADSHVLVVDDDSRLAPTMPIQSSIEYNDTEGAQAEDAIDSFGSQRNLVPNKVAVKTFDFKNPKDPLLVKVDTQRQMGTLPPMEYYEHDGLFTYKDFGEGDNLAQLKMEEAEARAKQFFGSGNSRSLTCGHVFDFQNHYSYRGDSFFVLRVQHNGSNNYFDRNAEEVYRNSFTCMRKAVPFRPPQTVQRPVMRGPQTATVVGPEGEEIYCDEYGRIKVQFHWDREGTFNEQSSCWIRVAMPWAGSRFGFMSIPRISQEVMVDFLEGDPDRPIVTASVYNELNMPPWDLPTNKTQTGILTRSSQNGTSHHANALRFEDKKDHEEVWLHAENDQRIEVEHNESHSVGHDRSKTIGHDETTHVKHDRTETVDHDEMITIQNKQRITVSESTAELFVDGSSRIVIVKEQYYLLAKNIYAEAGSEGITQRAATEIRQEIGADGDKYVKVDSGGHIEGASTTDINFKVGGNNIKIDSGGNIAITAATAITLTVGGSSLTVNASGVHLNGAAIDLTATAAVTLTGSAVKLNC